ncbi:MAG: MerR family transcriptional regulator [Alphaproteobacteria bacterium]|nr:MerR family transcriptional regulator [Alphaproteobacteria bacterium]
MFDPDKLYPANDPDLAVLGTYQTLAHWRSEGRGPPYVKLGAKVFYTGRDLNAWIASQRVTPGQPAAAA